MGVGSLRATNLDASRYHGAILGSNLGEDHQHASLELHAIRHHRDQGRIRHHDRGQDQGVDRDQDAGQGQDVDRDQGVGQGQDVDQEKDEVLRRHHLRDHRHRQLEDGIHRHHLRDRHRRRHQMEDGIRRRHRRRVRHHHPHRRGMRQCLAELLLLHQMQMKDLPLGLDPSDLLFLKKHLVH